MKKLPLILFVILLVPSLSACMGQNNTGIDDNDSTKEEEVPVNKDVEKNESTNDNVSLQDEQADMKNKMEALEFAEIEIEVDYPDHKDFEAEIDKDSSGNYKAEVEDEIHNNFLKGKDAFDYLYAILENMAITKESSKEEIIDKMLEAFELDPNYEKFEVEIIFHDGTKMEFEDRK